MSQPKHLRFTSPRAKKSPLPLTRAPCSSKAFAETSPHFLKVRLEDPGCSPGSRPHACAVQVVIQHATAFHRPAARFTPTQVSELCAGRASVSVLPTGLVAVLDIQQGLIGICNWTEGTKSVLLGPSVPSRTHTPPPVGDAQVVLLHMTVRSLLRNPALKFHIPQPGLSPAQGDEPTGTVPRSTAMSNRYEHFTAWNFNFIYMILSNRYIF